MFNHVAIAFEVVVGIASVLPFTGHNERKKEKKDKKKESTPAGPGGREREGKSQSESKQESPNAVCIRILD